MITFHARVASPEIYGLAEGPVWDAARQRVLWVDINAGAVHAGVHEVRRNGGDTIEARQRISVGGDENATVGAVACSVSGELLVAGTRHLYTVAPDSQPEAAAPAIGIQLIPDGKASRLNDGKCDPRGRFLVGSLALDDRRGEEVLLRIGHGGEITVLDDDLTLSNGLGWSPDGTVLYSIDTIPGIVWSRTYDPDTGATGPRREFLHLAGELPDGMCVDVDGNLWIAIWGAGQIRCYSRHRVHLATIDVAAPNTSSAAFVGPCLNTLLITTASEQLTDEQLADFPDAGRLFTCRVGTKGLPVTPWAGSRR